MCFLASCEGSFVRFIFQKSNNCPGWIISFCWLCAFCSFWQSLKCSRKVFLWHFSTLRRTLTICLASSGPLTAESFAFGSLLCKYSISFAMDFVVLQFVPFGGDQKLNQILSPHQKTAHLFRSLPPLPRRKLCAALILWPQAENKEIWFLPEVSRHLGLQFSSCDCFQYKVLLYSVDGRCLATYSAYDFALGAKSIAWSPTSQFLAVGSYDQKVTKTESTLIF